MRAAGRGRRRTMQNPADLFDQICTPNRGINRDTLEHVIVLAVEIAREGREGRRIGTLFTVGDADEVLKRSRNLILDPLYGHPRERRLISDPETRETIKELAQLDGGFVISDDGVAVSACRYINASAEEIRLPLGLGSRHMAAASISPRRCRAITSTGAASMRRRHSVCSSNTTRGTAPNDPWFKKSTPGSSIHSEARLSRSGGGGRFTSLFFTDHGDLVHGALAVLARQVQAVMPQHP